MAASGELGFSRDLRTEHVSTRSGMVFEAETRPLGSVPSIGIAEAGLALVGDSAIFGATAPLVGSRYRLQATANVGGLQYASVLADYRKYVMPVRPVHRGAARGALRAATAETPATSGCATRTSARRRWCAATARAR